MQASFAASQTRCRESSPGQQARSRRGSASRRSRGGPRSRPTWPVARPGQPSPSSRPHLPRSPISNSKSSRSGPDRVSGCAGVAGSRQSWRSASSVWVPVCSNCSHCKSSSASSIFWPGSRNARRNWRPSACKTPRRFSRGWQTTIGSRSSPSRRRCAARRGLTPIAASSAAPTCSSQCGPNNAAAFSIWPRPRLGRRDPTASRCSPPLPRRSALSTRRIRPRWSDAPGSWLPTAPGRRSSRWRRHRKCVDGSPLHRRGVGSKPVSSC